MRILVMVYEYPPVGGGGGQAAQDICVKLVERGHEVQVLTAHWGKLPLVENQAGVIINRVRSGRRLPYKAGLIPMAGYALASTLPARNLIKKWKPDVIHTHFAVPTGAATWAATRFTNTPYVLTAHLGDVPGGVPEKTGRWFSWIYPFTHPIWNGAAHTVGVSEFTRQLTAISYPQINMDVIPNGIDYQALDPGKIIINTPPRLIFAGRFMAQKNLINLVKILAALKDLSWECTLIGDGPQKTDILNEIQRHNLVDRFTLTGWITPAEVLENFRRSDILFMPSLSEGLPVVGVQGLTMGLALVMSRVGGCIDLVDHETNGYLVDRDNNTGFENALRNLVQNPNKLLSFRKASRQHVKQFDINTIVDSYEDIFKKVM
jgi:L-malate glycosyltransferase